MISTNFTEQVEKIPVDLTALLDNTVGFPGTEFTRLQAKYEEYRQWYAGEPLREKTGSGEQETEIYPTQYNPLPDAVEKHVSMLFGHYDLQDRPIVKPIVVPPENDDSWKEKAQKLEKYFDLICYENNYNGLLIDNGTTSQIYGGCVFKASYDDNKNIDPLRQSNIWISTIHPRYFVGIPSGLNYWDLYEAWIVRPISVLEAKTTYGISYEQDTSNDDITWLVEHYTKEKIETTIDGKIARRKIGEVTKPLSDVNPYGFVPIVYIPHIRSSGFYGDSLIDNTQGLLKEVNLRIADFGDAVSSDSHTTIAVSGQSDLRVEEAVKVGPRIKAIKVRLTGAGMGKETNPEVDQIKQTAHTSMGELVDRLLDMFSKTVAIPPVAYGMDEGSQRSSATLILRMWPLIAHAQIERAYWTVGLNRLFAMITFMLTTKDSKEFSKDFNKIRVKQDWHPYLPKDRDSLINEVAIRYGGGMTSIDKIIELLGDVADKEEEKKLILDFKEKVAKLEAATNPFGMQSGSKSPAQEKSTSAKENQNPKKPTNNLKETE